MPPRRCRGLRLRGVPLRDLPRDHPARAAGPPGPEAGRRASRPGPGPLERRAGGRGRGRRGRPGGRRRAEGAARWTCFAASAIPALRPRGRRRSRDGRAHPRRRRARRRPAKRVELDPRNAVAQRDLGFALLAAGKPDEALSAYRRAQQIEPRTNPEDALEHVRFAQGLAQADRPAEAVRIYRGLLDPAGPATRRERCLALQPVETSSFGSFPDFVRQVEKLRPHCNGLEHRDRAVELERNGQPREAIRELEEQLRKNPVYDETYFLLEGLLRRSGQPERAAEGPPPLLRSGEGPRGTVPELPLPARRRARGAGRGPTRPTGPRVQGAASRKQAVRAGRQDRGGGGGPGDRRGGRRAPGPGAATKP